MQLRLAVLPTLASVFAFAAPFAHAADCYPTGGCKNCEDRNSWFVARENFCGGNGWSQPGDRTWGWGEIHLSGQFSTEQQCWDGFEEIIDQCLGQQDGGRYNTDSAALNVAFCDCGEFGGFTLPGLDPHGF
ncbi:hypothetical protein BC628DRAFT_1334204 [Trametes gibbosa]|nr:hypothetical protein BC628DRAFT_1334204 [Trametes gibbosa]